METSVVHDDPPLPLPHRLLLAELGLVGPALAGQVDRDGERGTKLIRETRVAIKIVPSPLPTEVESAMCIHVHI